MLMPYLTLKQWVKGQRYVEGSPRRTGTFDTSRECVDHAAEIISAHLAGGNKTAHLEIGYYNDPDNFLANLVHAKTLELLEEDDD